jgi:alpha-glucoside transport system substrate-binding protein
MPEGGKNEKRRSLPLTRDDTFSEEIRVRSNQEKNFRKEYYMKKYLVIALALLVVAGFAFAGGSQSPSSTSGAKVVKVFGAFVDQEEVRFNEAMKPFEARTGIDVQYEASKEFETLIFVQVEGGNPPDVAALPQPGLMNKLADRGALVPLWPGIKDIISKNYAPVWLELGSYKGTTYGVFHRVNMKSLVWYPKKAWEDAGLTTPTTWSELEALENKAIGQGQVPWTVGFESGGATGWVGTDWVEDIMLRTAGPQVYDQWVKHQIPFNDPRVKNAVQIMGKRLRDPKYVYGGPQYVLTTYFGDAPNIMFDNPPKAWMHKQGNFITGFFPENIQANLDAEVGLFGFPQIDSQWGTPALGGGDQFTMFNDRPEVRQFMEYLATWESGKSWAAAGGALFPYKTQDLNAYPTAIERKQAELLLNAKVFRFDASDLMPAEVGAGTFWTGMVDYVSGVSVDKVLNDIEASWPK